MIHATPPPPLPSPIYREVGRVDVRSHGNVSIELGRRGRIPCSAPRCVGSLTVVQFHSRSILGTETWGHYIATEDQLEIHTVRWHFLYPVTQS